MLGLVAGCATEKPLIPPPLDLPRPAVAAPGVKPEAPPRAATPIVETPKPPPPERLQAGRLAASKMLTAPESEEANITLAFEQLPLPDFVQAVYGTILKKNVTLDAAVMNRKDLVTLRTGGPQTPDQVSDAVRLLLQSYGIAVFDVGGLVRVVPDTARVGYSPEIIRGRALPETPASLRPVFQLVELQAVRNPDVANWVKTLFGNKIDLKEDPSRNAVLLSGNAADVRAALEVIQVLDQPMMRGRHSIRINSMYWSADELARRLVEILVAEGYAASLPVAAGGISWPITVMPMAGANSVFVFAVSPQILDHVAAWAAELDRPNDKGKGRNLFSYTVQYTDAESLAKTLKELLSAPAAVAAPAGGRPASGAQVVVDRASNTIIIQGGGEDYGALRSLLQTLDKPAREALIEVTVAEVQLQDNLELGVEWLIKDLNIGDYVATASTLGGLGLGSSGLNIRFTDSSDGVRALINALATNNRATILSSPRIVAKNGESASIQVGQEVPIITSQQTNNVTTGDGILQTIQYRNTGVILNVKPVIHSSDQIDLEVQQEVSAAQSTTTGVSVSPTFTSRKVQTRLALRNGDTVLLGGLISTGSTDGDTGVPLLKDIPVLGQLFRKNNQSSQRTELIVLITPYIINDDSEAQALTRAFRDQLGTWARDIPLAEREDPPLKLRLDQPAIE
jgi:general secretion pathway protein D